MRLTRYPELLGTSQITSVTKSNRKSDAGKYSPFFIAAKVFSLKLSKKSVRSSYCMLFLIKEGRRLLLPGASAVLLVLHALDAHSPSGVGVGLGVDAAATSSSPKSLSVKSRNSSIALRLPLQTEKCYARRARLLHTHTNAVRTRSTFDIRAMNRVRALGNVIATENMRMRKMPTQEQRWLRLDKLFPWSRW